MVISACHCHQRGQLVASVHTPRLSDDISRLVAAWRKTCLLYGEYCICQASHGRIRQPRPSTRHLGPQSRTFDFEAGFFAAGFSAAGADSVEAAAAAGLAALGLVTLGFLALASPAGFLAAGFFGFAAGFSVLRLPSL